MIAAFENVRKTYPSGAGEVLAVDDVSLHLTAGEMVALVGPSGCGKSTCLGLLAGVDRPDGGRIRVCGLDLATANEPQLTDYRRRRLGIVFQSFYLMPHLTVTENVELPLGLAGERDAVRVGDLIERVGLAHRATHYPSQLSGGEQQRVALARALVHRPALLLADEPTGNLDSKSGRAVLDLLDELRREQGAALLLATHDPRLAAAADRTLRMNDGRLEPDS